MSRLLINLIVVLSLFAVGLAALPPTAAGRTLGSAELWTQYGGANFDDVCCMKNLSCDPFAGTVPNCNQQGPLMCDGQTMSLDTGSNDYACTDPRPGENCSHGTDVDCAYWWTCIWNNGVCGVTQQTIHRNPDFCADSCP
jgi:hypothetical protein